MQTLSKPTLIKRGLDARNSIINTVTVAHDVVCSTLGPGGANVLIQTDKCNKITKDGVSCLMSIVPESPFDSAVLNVIKDACMKTNSNVGDGTSSTVAIIADIILNASKRREGLNGIQLRNGLMLAANAIVEQIKANAVSVAPLDTPEGETQLRQIALISTNGDTELADMIVSIFKVCGEKANVKIEMSNTALSEYTIVDGFQLNKGYLSTYFADADGSVTMTDPDIYVSEKTVSNLSEITPIITLHMQMDKPFIIIAPKFELTILNTLVMYKLRGLKVCCVLLAEFGTSMRDTLEDIAILTGATLISEQTNVTFRTTDTIVPGSAKTVIIDEFKTTIIGAVGEKSNVNQRIDSLKAKLTASKAVGQVLGDIQHRIDNLAGGIAIMSVGGNTSARAHERYDLAEDALHACKAAIESGILPGGGSTLLQFSQGNGPFLEFFTKIVSEYGADSATHYGVTLMFKACQTISKWVITNALDLTAAYALQHKLFDASKNGHSFVFETFNLNTQEVYDALEIGVIDPADVLINEVLNAAEAAGTLLTMESIIVNTPKRSSDIADALTDMVN